MGSRLLFMLTLWMAISVALVSALTPLGPPSSRITGSAFNPATTAVVLKARAQSVPHDANLGVPDGDGAKAATSIMQWVVLAAATLVAIWLVRPVSAIAPATAPRARRRLPYRLHARAPPALT